MNADLETKLRVAEEELDLFNCLDENKSDENFTENNDPDCYDHEQPAAKRTRLNNAHSNYSMPLDDQAYTNSNGSSHAAFAKTLPELSDTPLDTVKIASDLKNLLLQEKIGQRLFAKEVPGITQSALSEMLLKPRPWEECTDYKKRLYQKMYTWSQSKEEVEKLKALSASRDRRSTCMMNGSSTMNHSQFAQLNQNGHDVYDGDATAEKYNDEFWDENEQNFSNCDDMMMGGHDCDEENNGDLDEDFFGENGHQTETG